MHKYNYDEISDTFTITFSASERATGIELNDHILLRINNRRAVGISIFDFSILAQATDFGWRSLPLTGVSNLNPEIHAIVLDILHSDDVQSVLSLSLYTPSLRETIPILPLQTA